MQRGFGASRAYAHAKSRLREERGSSDLSHCAEISDMPGRKDYDVEPLVGFDPSLHFGPKTVVRTDVASGVTLEPTAKLLHEGRDGLACNQSKHICHRV